MAVNDEILAQAKKDLARRTGIFVKRITLTEIETIDWPDASLGCPQEGKIYAQLVTNGYRLVLPDGTANIEYHTDRN
jgi:hypothetical protein